MCTCTELSVIIRTTCDICFSCEFSLLHPVGYSKALRAMNERSAKILGVKNNSSQKKGTKCISYWTFNRKQWKNCVMSNKNKARNSGCLPLLLMTAESHTFLLKAR